MAQEKPLNPKTNQVRPSYLKLRDQNLPPPQNQSKNKEGEDSLSLTQQQSRGYENSQPGKKRNNKEEKKVQGNQNQKINKKKKSEENKDKRDIIAQVQEQKAEAFNVIQQQHQVTIQNQKNDKQNFHSRPANKSVIVDYKPSQNLKQVIREFRNQKNVDVLLLLDCTSSMGRWIEEAKENLITIIQQLKEKSSDFSFRVGFVGYRDFGDKVQFVSQPFTNDVKKIVELISKQRAEGGGDEAEDLIGALTKSLEFNFDKRHSLHFFLICDAPCHGKQYHGDQITDNHSNKVKLGILENLMKLLGLATQLVKFTCFRIKENTDLMFQIMKKHFKEGVGLEIIDHCKPEDFSYQVRQSLQTTIQQTRLLQQECSKPLSICPEAPQRMTINSALSNNFVDATQITYSFPKINFDTTLNYWKYKFCKSLKENSQDCKLKIKKHHFNEGIENLVYDVEIEGSRMEFVAKIPKDRQENEAVQEEKAKEMMISSAYAYQLTKHFTQDTYDISDAPMLFYIPPMRIVLKNNYGHLKHLYLEPKLKNSENYVKISNNFDTCQKWTFASFSHYTYAITKGYLMVTDLQGVGSILTDPAIQSEDRERFSGKVNLGLVGYGQFFASQHPKCSQQICDKLKIQNSRPADTNQQSSIMSNPEPNLSMEQTIGVCGFCFSQGIVNVKEYRQIQKKTFGFHYSCEECRIKLKVKDIAKCLCCNSYWEYNKYFYDSFKKNPKYCKKCQKLPKEQKQRLKKEQQKFKKEYKLKKEQENTK